MKKKGCLQYSVESFLAQEGKGKPFGVSAKRERGLANKKKTGFLGREIDAPPIRRP